MIKDPEVQLLAALAEGLEDEYQTDEDLSAAHARVFEKEFLVSNTGALAGLSGQHRGAEGRDTAWLSVSPANVHPWMNDFGGDLGTAMRRLRTLVGLR